MVVYVLSMGECRKPTNTDGYRLAIRTLSLKRKLQAHDTSAELGRQGDGVRHADAGYGGAVERIDAGLGGPVEALRARG